MRGWDFFDHDNNPDDSSSGHGTHTAGTVGAEGNNGIGVAGVNWQCKLMPLRFLGPAGGTTSDAILCVQYAAANGAKVSNNSWGGGGFSQALADAIANAGQQGHTSSRRPATTAPTTTPTRSIRRRTRSTT
ncbi:MAG: S8 family serine peptidase [Planctomycetota bacterium]